MPYYTFNCKTCGETKTGWRSNLEDPPTYCSRQCHSKDPNRKYGKSPRVERIIKHCLTCNKEIEVTQSQLNHGRGKFCGRPCATKYHHAGLPKPKSRDNVKKAIESNIGRVPWNKKESVEITCKICGRLFAVIPARKDKAKYCSRECSHEAKRRITGPGHPLWTRVEMQCEWCGENAWVKQAKVHEFKFCSRQCQGSHIAKQMAEQNGPTSIEKMMMDELDSRNIKYRTQHQIAVWLIDITLPEHRIAIECDGDYWHSSEEQQAKDANKNNWLRAHKWAIFRFSGSEIRQSPKACIDKVISSIK